MSPAIVNLIIFVLIVAIVGCGFLYCMLRKKDNPSTECPTCNSVPPVYDLTTASTFESLTNEATSILSTSQYLLDGKIDEADLEHATAKLNSWLLTLNEPQTQLFQKLPWVTLEGNSLNLNATHPSGQTVKVRIAHALPSN